MLREAGEFDHEDHLAFELAEANDADTPPSTGRIRPKDSGQAPTESLHRPTLPRIEDYSSFSERATNSPPGRGRWWSGHEDAVIFFLLGFIATTCTLFVDMFVIELFS